MGDCCCFIMVPENQVAVVETCGKFDRVSAPGLDILKCPCEAVRAVVSLKIQQLDVKCDTKTKDNVFVAVNVAVLYKVVPEEVVNAYYKLTDHRAQMKSYVFDGIRSSFPSLDLDDSFSSKKEIAEHVLVDMRSSMKQYGYHIVDCLITDINPDVSVQRAMNEINASQRLREAANYKADAEKILLVKAAEADSESKYLVGVGVAKQRKAIMDGLQASISEFATQVDGAGPKDVMDLLLVTQYFDTLKDVGVRGVQGGPGKTLFLPHGPQAVTQLRNDLKGSFMSGLDKGK
jgi:regulator of protease activity HflC (stomatin/prohibitin superfamily)